MLRGLNGRYPHELLCESVLLVFPSAMGRACRVVLCVLDVVTRIMCKSVTDEVVLSNQDKRSCSNRYTMESLMDIGCGIGRTVNGQPIRYDEIMLRKHFTTV